MGQTESNCVVTANGVALSNPHATCLSHNHHEGSLCQNKEEQYNNEKPNCNMDQSLLVKDEYIFGPN